jgi:hypothetical protein
MIDVAGVVHTDKLGITILLARGGQSSCNVQIVRLTLRVNSEVDLTGEFGG